MKAFPGVSLGDGRVRDLLVLSTWPNIDASTFEFRVYVFDVCGATPQLLFGVGMGYGVNGFVSGFDVRDGVLAISRLWSANAFVRLRKAMEVWNTAEPSFRYTRYAQVAREAVFQYFHLVDPEHQDGTNWVNHKGLALLPAFGGDGSALRAAVGLVGSGYSKDGRPMTGLPVSIHFYEPGATYVPTDPYQGPEKGVDPRAFPGPKMPWAPYPEVVADVAAVVNGVAKTTNLLVAVEALGTAPGGNHLRILDEANPMNAQDVGHWPAEGEEPFGPDKEWSLDSRSATVDPATKLVAVKAKRADGVWNWFVLDVRNTLRPSVIAQLPFGGSGSLMNGKLWIADSMAGLVQVVKVAPVKISTGGCGDDTNPECDQSAPPETNLAVTDMRRDPVQSQAHRYGAGLAEDLDATTRQAVLAGTVSFNASGVSMPANGERNNAPAWFKVTLQRPSDLNVVGFCVTLHADATRILLMGMEAPNSPRVSLIGQRPSPDTPGQVIEEYRLELSISQATRALFQARVPNTVSYQVTVYGQRGDTVVRSAQGYGLGTAPASMAAFDPAHRPDLWPLYRGSLAYGQRYDTAGETWADAEGVTHHDYKDWCAPGVYRFLANPNNEPLRVRFGAVTREHGNGENHSGHDLGTDVDFINPAPDTLEWRATGSGYYDQLASLIRQGLDWRNCALPAGSDPASLTPEEQERLKREQQERARQTLAGWVREARVRLREYLRKETVGQVFYCESGYTASNQINQLLRSGVVADAGNTLDLGEGPWDIDLPNLEKLTPQSTHRHHFHVTFDSLHVNEAEP